VHALQIHDALAQEPVPGVLGRSRQEADHRQREPGTGRNGPRPSASTSTSRLMRSPWPIAYRAAIAPPSVCPTSAGGDGQLC
jgi:hypothetical protein